MDSDNLMSFTKWADEGEAIINALSDIDICDYWEMKEMFFHLVRVIRRKKNW